MRVQAGRCHHCSRPVLQTVHGRRGARVDHYRSVVGAPHVEFVDDPTNAGTKVRIIRVEGLHEIVTCRDCWDSPSARAALEAAWRTGELPPRA